MAAARRKKRWLTRFRSYLNTDAGKRMTRRPALTLVVGVALYVSYWHIRDAALEHGYDLVSASILPLSVDGLVLVAARYINEAKTKSGRNWALAAFGLGALATMAGNWLAAPPDDVIGIGFALWPAIAVLAAGWVLHKGEAKPKPQSRPRKAAEPAKKPARSERVAKARETVTA